MTCSRAVLEVELRKFACLTRNDRIAVRYADQVLEFQVQELKPRNAVCIIECDLNLEFDAPEGYVDPPHNTYVPKVYSFLHTLLHFDFSLLLLYQQLLQDLRHSFLLSPEVACVLMEKRNLPQTVFLREDKRKNLLFWVLLYVMQIINPVRYIL